MRIRLQDLLGKGYGRFFKFKGRYRLAKGSRNSKKSVNMIQLAPVWDIISNEVNNVMVLRAVDKDNRQSTFANIKKGIRRFGAWDKFKIKESTMEITYKPTGQKIFFRGCNDPDSITSVTVEVGVLNKLYIEEAFQIKDYETFRKIDGSFRGQCPNDSYYQVTIIFNPWKKDHWLYEKFFKDRLEDDYLALLEQPKIEYVNEEEIIPGGFGKGLYLMTNNYKINEFRDIETWDAAMEEMRLHALEYFKVEGLGMWGLSTGKCYMYYKGTVKHSELAHKKWCGYSIGVDIGMGSEGVMIKNTKGQPERYRSAMTMSLTGFAEEWKEIVGLGEYFYSKQNDPNPKTAVKVADEMVETILKWIDLYQGTPVLMKGTVIVYVESADPGGFIDLLRDSAIRHNFRNIVFKTATKNRVQTRVDIENLMMAFDEMIISNQCVNLDRELTNSKEAEDGRPREDADDHVINAFEYSWIPFLPQIKRYKQYKEH